MSELLYSKSAATLLSEGKVIDNHGKWRDLDALIIREAEIRYHVERGEIFYENSWMPLDEVILLEQAGGLSKPLASETLLPDDQTESGITAEIDITGVSNLPDQASISTPAVSEMEIEETHEHPIENNAPPNSPKNLSTPLQSKPDTVLVEVEFDEPEMAVPPDDLELSGVPNDGDDESPVIDPDDLDTHRIETDSFIHENESQTNVDTTTEENVDKNLKNLEDNNPDALSEWERVQKRTRIITISITVFVVILIIASLLYFTL